MRCVGQGVWRSRAWTASSPSGDRACRVAGAWSGRHARKGAAGCRRARAGVVHCMIVLLCCREPDAGAAQAHSCEGAAHAGVARQRRMEESAKPVLREGRWRSLRGAGGCSYREGLRPAATDSPERGVRRPGRQRPSRHTEFDCDYWHCPRAGSKVEMRDYCTATKTASTRTVGPMKEITAFFRPGAARRTIRGRTGPTRPRRARQSRAR